MLHKIIIDFINPKDIKKGLLKKKNFFKSLTIIPEAIQKEDEKLIQKNLKKLNINFPPDEILSVKEIKSESLYVNFTNFKNFYSLRKSTDKIKQNWKIVYDNPNLDHDVKIKLMGILTLKDQLKNKIEDQTLEYISKILNQDLYSDKNNKISKQLIKLYREDIYDINIDDRKMNDFVIPNLTAGKAKILQENKDYLNNVYFDIYNDILYDIFDSGVSIADFNDQIKGSSILKNFELGKKNKNPVKKISTINKDFILRNIENFKSSRKTMLYLPNSLNSERYKVSINADDDTRSNYDRLGLANQTYINNILLRDFTYKEKLDYIDISDSENEKSDTSVDNVISNVLDSNSLMGKNFKQKSSIGKLKALKFFREPIRKITNRFLSLYNDKQGDEGENSYIDEIKKNSSKDFHDEVREIEDENGIIMKKKKREKSKKVKKTKYSSKDKEKEKMNLSFYGLCKINFLI